MPIVNLGHYFNSDTSACKIFLDEEKKINAVTLGVGSYGESFVETDGKDFLHVLIGRYSSIGEQTNFLLAENKKLHSVSNYPPFVKKFRHANFVHHQVIIGNDVCIGRSCKIFGGVQIGNGAIVNENSVVTENVPAYAIVEGNPAKVVGYRFTADIIDKLQKIKWWYWDKETIETRLPLMEDVRKFSEKFDVPNLPLPIVKELEALKNANTKIYFLITDVGVDNPVWEKVLAKYVQSWSKIGKSALVVGGVDVESTQQIFSRLSSLVREAGLSEIPVMILNLGKTIHFGILSNIDVFISTREEFSSIYFDYATDYDKKIISGLDENIFESAKSVSVHEKTPLLSIGIPTYNRRDFLNQLLTHICPIVGDDSRVEIFISNNDSPDDTEEIVKPYMKMYSNVRYHRNSENIGGDRNVFQCYKFGRGKFVMAHGDDDVIAAGAWKKVLEIISRDDGCGVIGLQNIPSDFKISHGTTISDYVESRSYWMTFITHVILRKSAISELPEPDKCIYTQFNQMYLQLEILKSYPNWYVLSGSLSVPDHKGSSPSGYNYMQAFIKNYFDLLNDYANLSKEQMSREKLKILCEHVFRYFALSKSGQVALSVENAEKIFEEYYKDEPYYRQAIEEFMKIDAATSSARWSKYLN